MLPSKARINTFPLSPTVDPAVQHVQQSGNVTQNLVQQGQIVTQQDQTAQKESPQAVQPKQPITQQSHGQLQRTKSDSNSADENSTPHRKISLGIPRVRGQPRQKSLLDTPHWAILPPPSKFTTDTPEEVVRSGQFVPTGTIITAETSDRSERAGLERTAPTTRGYSDSDSSSSENDQPKDIRGRDQSRDIDSVSSSSSHSSSNALRASRESVDGENRLTVVAPVPPPRRKPAHSRSSSLDLQKLFNKGGNSLSLQKYGDHGKDTSQGNQENFANFEDFNNKVENLTRASENPPRFGHRRSASLDSTHSASVEQPSQPTTTEDVKVEDVSNINSRFHSPGSVPRPVPRKKAGGPPPPLNRQDNSSDSIPEKEKKISKEPIHFVVRPVTRLEQLHAKIRDLKSKNTRLSKINNDLQQEVKEMMEARVSLESSLEQLKPFPK
ncbi:ralBP1-associated Eps domain-containing protein 1-like [Xenia sp. Carnegie-2017]|uniref:ralBP1-associated Eps domain-containing protein 1-like n=1 Tax=Xenia sp. Carnegie-2017 TaxID=2897299 RepID=UPI001F035238|nr:ralBP1-associated Eps domain-containing protein 1-like [Xenia sp. Carnegie-2017]